MKQSCEEAGEEEQIRVYLRLRPLRNELSKRTLKLVNRGVAFHYKDNRIHQLYFDDVFDEVTSQQQIYEAACMPIVENVLRGNNGSLFVYGQTGTGKTYTMGTLEAIKREDQGLIPLALKHMWEHLSSSKGKDDWRLCISFMQIYMEDIYDLFNPSNGKLQIRESPEQGETYVEDLVVVSIEDYKQAIELINSGLKYRKVGNQVLPSQPRK
jgi:kinesin family member 5